MIRSWKSLACAALAALAAVAVTRGLDSWAWLLVLALPPWDLAFKTISAWVGEAVQTWAAGQQAIEQRERFSEAEKAPSPVPTQRGLVSDYSLVES